VTDFLKFSDPLHISATVEGREGHITYFLKFWDPLHISATVEARNFKFGMEIGHWGT